MNTFTVTKDFGITKVSAKAKADVNGIIMDALVAAYGQENVKMVRMGSSTETNAIGVRVGELIEDGFSYELCLTVESTVKSHKDKVTKRYTVEAFDFDSAVAKYEKYVDEKIERERDKAEKKTKDIAKRNEKAQREKEVKEAIQKVKEKAEN